MAVGERNELHLTDNAKLCFIFISLISTKADSISFTFYSVLI